MDTRKESQAEEPEVVVAGRGERRRCCSRAGVALPEVDHTLCVLLPPFRAAWQLWARAMLPMLSRHPSRGSDTAYREVGLSLAAAAMRRGELARVWAGPRYGYGQQGSFSFPTVPPDARLV